MSLPQFLNSGDNDLNYEVDYLTVYCSAVGNKRQSIPPVYHPRGHTPERKRNRRGLPSTQKSIAAQGYVYTRILVPPPAWRFGNDVVLSLPASANDGVSKVSRGPQVGAHLTRGTDGRDVRTCDSHALRGGATRAMVAREGRATSSPTPALPRSDRARNQRARARFLFVPFGRFGDFSPLLLQSISRGAETRP